MYLPVVLPRRGNTSDWDHQSSFCARLPCLMTHSLVCQCVVPFLTAEETMYPSYLLMFKASFHSYIVQDPALGMVPQKELWHPYLEAQLSAQNQVLPWPSEASHLGWCYYTSARCLESPFYKFSWTCRGGEWHLAKKEWGHYTYSYFKAINSIYDNLAKERCNILSPLIYP